MLLFCSFHLIAFTTQYNTTQYDTIRYHTIGETTRYDAIQCDIIRYTWEFEEETRGPLVGSGEYHNLQTILFPYLGRFSLCIIHLFHANNATINHGNILASLQNSINLNCYPGNKQFALHGGQPSLVDNHIHGQVRLERKERLIETKMQSSSSEECNWVFRLVHHVQWFPVEN